MSLDEGFRSRLSSSQRRTFARLAATSPTPLVGSFEAAGSRLVTLTGALAMKRRGELDADVRAFVRTIGRSFGAPTRASGFTEAVAVELPDGATRVTLGQRHGEVPVYGSGITLDISAGHIVSKITGRFASLGKFAPGAPTRQAHDVRASVRELLVSYDRDAVDLSEAELVVLDPASLLGESGDPHLAWRVGVEGESGIHDVLVDDLSGQVIVVVPPSPTSIAVGHIDVGNIDVGRIAVGPIPQYHLNPATGTPDFVTFQPVGVTLPESATGDPVRVALALFARYPLLYGTGDVPNQLRVRHVQVDPGPRGMRHVVLDQVYAGLAVVGAELHVHLSENLAVTSVSGVYVRDPGVLVTPTVAQDTARDSATRAVAATRSVHIGKKGRVLVRPHSVASMNDRYSSLRDIDVLGDLRDQLSDLDLWPILNDTRTEVTDLGLVVLPLVLSDVPQARNHVAWRFRFTEADVFVDAHDGRVVFATPNRFNARKIYDGGGRPVGAGTAFSPLILVDGANVAPTPAGNPDVLPSDARLATSIGFWATLGRPSWDGSGADSKLVTNVVFPNPNAMFVPVVDQWWFGLGEIAQDVVTHEYTHGVTWTTAGLFYLDESGALNEHYSDVMGNLSAPDATPGGWLIGELTTAGTVRDMANPASFGDPGHYALFRRRGAGCTGVLDVVTNAACDMGFVHSNSGIGNLAAVRLSDGDGTTAHPGIGRSRLGRIFADTLTTRLHPWARYLDEMHNSWEVARDLGVRGVVPAPLPADPNPPAFDTTVPNEVAWAFQQVGVDRRLTTGWFQLGGGISGGSGFQTFYAGETMPAGFIVGDVELVVRGIFENLRYWEGRALASTGGAVAFDGGVYGATITAHGIGTANKETTVRWFHSGFLPLEITVNIVAATVTTPGPVVLPTVIEVVSGAQVHWGGLGGKGDDLVSPGQLVSGTGCVIDDVILELMDRNYVVQSTNHLNGMDAKYGSTGARITSNLVGTNDKTVGVHWWYDLGSACRYQIRYLIRGNGCS